jgi:hypothetical protein
MFQKELYSGIPNVNVAIVKKRFILKEYKLSIDG